MKIGQTIKDLRERKGINQGVFSKKIGISQTSLSQIESDKKYPHPGTIKKIAKTFEVPESVIYLLSLKNCDIPKTKRHLYDSLYPVIKQLLYSLID